MSDSTFHRALRIWGRDGFISLLRAGVRIKCMRPVVERWSAEDMIPTDEVQRRCAEEGRLWEYDGEFDSDEIKKEIQSQHEDSDYLFRVREAGYDWSPRLVCELRDASVLGEDAFVLNSDGDLVCRSVSPVNPQEDWGLYSRETGLRFRALRYKKDVLSSVREPTRIENAMSMVTFIDIYGHWLQEYLPMLLHLSVYEEKTGREPDIIVDKNPPDWMLETLRILGYPEERVVEWNNDFAVVDRLVLPNASRVAHTPRRCRMSPVEYRWLREQFLDAVEGTDTSKNERFYISRQGMRNPSGMSAERYVTNFDEVREVLSDFDIEVVRPETMTIEEQVRKFSRGGLFVGPRGSGLHNTLFAKNSKTVEIYTPNTRHHIQHLFDYALGHEWTYIIGSEYDKSTDSEEDRNMPFRVNPDVLRSKLEDVLSDEKTTNDAS